VEGLAVTRPPGSGWHAAAFRLSWAGRQALVFAATESAPGMRGGGSPGALWGGDLACTDARAAFVQLQGGVPLIVLGTRATVTAGVRHA
jgi:hypothetical protein